MIEGNYAEMFGSVFFGGALVAFIFASILIIALFIVAFYIYFSLAWYTIAKKLKYKYAWLAWIPFANLSMMLQLGGFHWAWVFLILIPIFGWIALLVLLIIANWKIFEYRGYPGWFSLTMIIPRFGGILYLVAIGFVAWGVGNKNEGVRKKENITNKKRNSKNTVKKKI
jgi:hypothetical protein